MCWHLAENVNSFLFFFLLNLLFNGKREEIVNFWLFTTSDQRFNKAKMDKEMQAKHLWLPFEA